MIWLILGILAGSGNKMSFTKYLNEEKKYKSMQDEAKKPITDWVILFVANKEIVQGDIHVANKGEYLGSANSPKQAQQKLDKGLIGVKSKLVGKKLVIDTTNDIDIMVTKTVTYPEVKVKSLKGLK